MDSTIGKFQYPTRPTRDQKLVPVSINVSARQFRESNVVTLLSSCLTRYRIDPALIEIELAESSMIEEGHNVI